MHRRRRGLPTSNVEPDLPITPMLDMSFQLLAFFITTYNPTPTEGHLDVGLPAEKGSQSTKLPDPTDAELIEDLTVRVESDEKGDIAAISLMQGAPRKHLRLWWHTHPPALEITSSSGFQGPLRSGQVGP